jgi:hypothetical protein
MITLADYWMGRDATHPLDMTPQIERNAIMLLELVNKLLVVANTAGVRAPLNQRGTVVRSGWRPPAVNAATPKAAVASKHMTGQAIDIEDPSGALDRWLYGNVQVLKDIGIWCEHPVATPTWSHMQSVPPGSGNRFFYP